MTTGELVPIIGDLLKSRGLVRNPAGKKTKKIYLAPKNLPCLLLMMSIISRAR
jgi:hypothetical protein